MALCREHPRPKRYVAEAGEAGIVVSFNTQNNAYFPSLEHIVCGLAARLPGEGQRGDADGHDVSHGFLDIALMMPGLTTMS
jgi:hypothetical protein